MRLNLFRILLLVVILGGILFFHAESLLHQEVVALMAFKRAIIEDPLAVLSDWNAQDREPCDWFGVACGRTQSHVISLNLSRTSLKGFLAPELGMLNSLQELILDHNLVFGTIPKQIGMLTNLIVLDLSVNRLAGPIPSELGNLNRITKINLHFNGLTGSIPLEFSKLVNLVELRLDRNRLVGPILPIAGSYQIDHNRSINNNSHGTNLCQFPRLKIGDFSYNFLVGKIPSCLNYLPGSSFQGNCLQDEHAALQRSPQICVFPNGHGVSNGTSKHPSKKPRHQKLQQPEWVVIIEICIVFSLIVFIITLATIACIKFKRKPNINILWRRNSYWKERITIALDGKMLKDVNSYSRQELQIACEDFSNIIGSSPDIVVYKGTKKDGPEIAVISLCNLEDQWTNYLELHFQSKVADMARLNHEHTGKLLGYCKENNPFSRMLVFDYASNGTLYEHLHYGEGCQLSWFRRMKISLGIARGLRYLHTELHPPFIVSELNSSAVYLTEDFTPKLVDFECWKMVLSKSEKSSGLISSGGSVHNLVGSVEEPQLDVQSNIFGFGVLLLEVISRKQPFFKDGGCLVEWASEYLQKPDEIWKLVDPDLKDVKAEELAVICSVVSLCIDPDPSKRPSMQIIAAVLENGIDISAAAVLQDSPLAWAELALAS